MEGDLAVILRQSAGGISIHTLRVEGGNSDEQHTVQGLTFQSTPSAWRVTDPGVLPVQLAQDFNPHPPHGG